MLQKWRYFAKSGHTAVFTLDSERQQCDQIMAKFRHFVKIFGTIFRVFLIFQKILNLLW